MVSIAQNEIKAYEEFIKSRATKNIPQYNQTSDQINNHLRYDDITKTFDYLPESDNAGVIKQLTGYDWVVRDKHETKENLFPKSFTYSFYSTHPQYRVANNCLFDNEGRLRAVLFLYFSKEKNVLFCKEKLDITSNILTSLMINAYRNGANEVNQATKKQRDAIEYILGLNNESDYGIQEEMPLAKKYCKTLEEECRKKISDVSYITRIDSTHFKFFYMDENGVASIPVSISVQQDGSPYTVKCNYSFPGQTRSKRKIVHDWKQSDGEEILTLNDEDKVFDVVEQMPTFPGGMGALYQWINKNPKYPVAAEADGIQGRVIVCFNVGKDGTISNATISKSVNPMLDKEAVRLVNSMPNWIPGKQNGKNVTVRYILPIPFRLH